MAWVLGHRQTKGAATDIPSLPPPRHTSTLPFEAIARGRSIWALRLPPRPRRHRIRISPQSALLLLGFSLGREQGGILGVLAIDPRHALPHHLCIHVDVAAIDPAQDALVSVLPAFDHQHLSAMYQSVQRLS